MVSVVSLLKLLTICGDIVQSVNRNYNVLVLSLINKMAHFHYDLRQLF